LIRFVNSLLDPLQKRDKSLPLNVLAESAGLPTAFVDIRHWGTHESNIPGTEVLRDMGIRALEWLYRNYWNKVTEEPEDVVVNWKTGIADISHVVDAFRVQQETCFQRLIAHLGEDEEFSESKQTWDPLISQMSARLTGFLENFIEYTLELLVAMPSSAFLDFISDCSFTPTTTTCSRAKISADYHLMGTSSPQRVNYERPFRSTQLHQRRTTMRVSS
jgi:Las1-like